ncbi:MAG: MOSC domain-containing protein [Planctomycetota bacterium]
MQTIADLLKSHPQLGRVEWIGASPARRAPVQALPSTTIHAGTGLAEDHHARSGRSKRQVTLIQWEHLAVVASILARESLPPELIRRNIAISGINVAALKDQRFRLGNVLLEGTGYCHPCSRMEEVLGPGGYQAMRGHGGITARVLEGAEVTCGDVVQWIEKPLSAE